MANRGQRPAGESQNQRRRAAGASVLLISLALHVVSWGAEAYVGPVLYPSMYQTHQPELQHGVSCSTRNLWRRRRTVVCLATSSQQLKESGGGKSRKRGAKKEKNKKETEKHSFAGARLARATARAVALQKHQESLKKQQNKDSNDNRIGSLQKLTKAIDQQLTARRRRASSFVRNGKVNEATDSMSLLLGYNDRVLDRRKSSCSTTCNVAVVFGKPLIKDQVTVEYASRIRALVQTLQEQEELNKPPPALIIFCGGIAPGNHVADADAGYIFFRHLCQSQNVRLDDVQTDIVLDRTTSNEAEALRRVAKEIRQRLKIWLGSSELTEECLVDLSKKKPSFQKRTIHVHVMLISTEYHLCNLNDIHHLSPGQSFLQPIENLATEYNDNRHDTDGDDYDCKDDDLEGAPMPNKRQGPQPQEMVETSWSFRYATYPYAYAKDEAAAFIGRCYLLGQELRPSYVNIRGVVDDTEFFQRDNFLVLASIRRSLVSNVEALYKAPQSLRTGIRQFGGPPGSPRRSMDVILEGALLSLGRCIDIVRPAGLLVSSVPASDWKKALRLLEHCVTELRTTCDPDTALEPAEWGKLGSDESGVLDIGTVEEGEGEEFISLGNDEMEMDEANEDQENATLPFNDLAVFCDD